MLILRKHLPNVQQLKSSPSQNSKKKVVTLVAVDSRSLLKYNATLVAVDGGNVLINNNTATLVAMRVNIKETPT